MPALGFSNLTSENLERVRDFASLALNNVLKCSCEEIESRWMNEIKELLSNEGTIGVVAQISGTICGLAICAPLPWESPLLGKSMWAIKHIAVASRSGNGSSIATGFIEEVVRRVIARDADFLLCKVAPTDTTIIHALESNGFLLMDTLLNFVCDCRATGSNGPPQQLPEGFVIRLATTADIQQLVEIAHASFVNHFGRFHADP